MNRASIYVGVMTGTSLDGIDVVVADFAAAQPAVLAHHFAPYPADLATEMLALQHGCADELHRSQLASNALAIAIAPVVLQALQLAQLKPSAVAAAGVHGQTVRHSPVPAAGAYTVQLLNAALLAELTGISIVTDFRRRDIAAGGQGAPLVPAFHRSLLGHGANVAIVNIGGFANVSVLQGGVALGFDTGPGNVLLDAWTHRHFGKAYDADGQIAASGQVHDGLLAQLLQHPFFAAPPPKSTGREAFHLPWLEACIHAVDKELAAADHAANVLASLTELTAHSIAQALKPYGVEAIYVCGGGALNTHLMQRLQHHLSTLGAGVSVSSTAALGIAPMQMEALAFAWLAQRTLHGLAGNEPAVTGAAGLRVLGAIYPA